MTVAGFSVRSVARVGGRHLYLSALPDGLLTTVYALGRPSRWELFSVMDYQVGDQLCSWGQGRETGAAGQGPGLGMRGHAQQGMETGAGRQGAARQGQTGRCMRRGAKAGGSILASSFVGFPSLLEGSPPQLPSVLPSPASPCADPPA
jgi:hypothetical protein